MDLSEAAIGFSAMSFDDIPGTGVLELPPPNSYAAALSVSGQHLGAQITQQAVIPSNAIHNNYQASVIPQYSSIRFMDNQVGGGGSARTKLNKGTPAHQTFVPVRLHKKLPVDIVTPTIASRKRTSEDISSADHDDDSMETPGRTTKRTRFEREDPQGSRQLTTRPGPGLRMHRPLKNAEKVDMDVWRIIMRHAPLEFLLRMKVVSRTFRTILKEEKDIWCKSRVNQHGKDMPGPPNGMTEEQFAQLLDGQGCQNYHCAAENTEKVYWAFRLRLCQKCLVQKTMREEAIHHYRFSETITQSLLQLIQAAVVDSGKYSRVRLWLKDQLTWETTAAGPLYLTSDLDNIEAQFNALVLEGKSAAEIQDWKAGKKAEAADLSEQLAAIEEWKKRQADNAARHRHDRIEFFEAQAAKLNPPIPGKMLKKMLAFKMSLDANSPPNEAKWKILERKITPYVAEAQILLDYEAQMSRVSSDEYGSQPPRPDYDEFVEVGGRRTAAMEDFPDNLLPEQRVVYDLGKEQLEYWQNKGVDDSDLVLRVLYGVRDNYQGADPHGSHQLILDDARLVIQHVLEPEVTSWNDSSRKIVALESFKCSGCPRKDCKTKYTFFKGFEHIYTAHSQYVGEDYEYCIFAKPFPRQGTDQFAWYTTTWPKKLPLVAAHQAVTREEKYSPNEPIPYVPAKAPNTTSAFSGRRAANFLSPASDDFAGNLVYAAKQLCSTRLSSDVQTRIALQFALDRYATVQGPEKPKRTVFTDAIKEVKGANSTFDFRYRCSTCAQQPNAARTTKFIKSPVQFQQLEEHFDKKHSDMDWTVAMMELPSDTQLLDNITQADAKLEDDKTKIAAREKARAATARRKKGGKSKVTLDATPAMDVFDILFPYQIFTQ